MCMARNSIHPDQIDSKYRTKSAFEINVIEDIDWRKTRRQFTETNLLMCYKCVCECIVRLEMQANDLVIFEIIPNELNETKNKSIIPTNG